VNDTAVVSENNKDIKKMDVDYIVYKRFGYRSGQVLARRDENGLFRNKRITARND
jgi:hypothetical protein